jgi:hypothetical protein
MEDTTTQRNATPQRKGKGEWVCGGKAGDGQVVGVGERRCVDQKSNFSFMFVVSRTKVDNCLVSSAQDVRWW